MPSILEAAETQTPPYNARPLELIIPGRPPEVSTVGGVSVQGPPEPDGSLLAVLDWRFVLTLTPERGVDLSLAPYTRVFFKLPDGKNGELEVPSRIDSIAVDRNAETAAFLTRDQRDGRLVGIVVLIQLTRNEVVLAPLIYPDAATVVLGKRGFVLLNSDGKPIRSLPLPARTRKP